ncbi:XPC-binding domain-containing protein [Sphaerosporella brunnea]|uniref:UV excision repair protein RAD23 n=1 Tax=Sphaerosporella brunnea TaxID=1250544 RepID=A0A5J5F3F1_9PEZI|nr:XPC-binding domain-containing protein [Sphaerosporella brunnea]
MKLTFKDLKQQKFTLDAEPSDTVAQVKDKIFKFKNEEKEWEPSLQKLIYSGKILADDKTVESYKVEEKGFVVCMLAKPKAPAAASSSSTPAQAPSTPVQAPKAAAPPPAPAPTQAPAASTATAAAPATPSPAGASFNDPSALAMGPQLQAAIQNMLEMGFTRGDIDRAMRAAFNNPDRAVEYLMTGIPEHLLSSPRPAQGQPASQPAGQSAAPEAAAGGEQQAVDPENINLFEAAAAAAANRGSGSGARAGAGASGAGAISGLDFLRNNPQFQQLRQLVQESPAMLEPILQQVGAGNPQLAALISQNPEAFLQLLSEGVEGEEGSEGFNTISVTPEEAAAIDRLCALGFHRDLVIQAYIACDKNEELAANYLFDHGGDDDEMGP